MEMCPILNKACKKELCAWYTDRNECAVKTLGEAVADLSLMSEIEGIKVREE